MNLAKLFHPAVGQWFIGHFTEPTPAQTQAWPPIKAGRHTLIAAPTDSGKTLAAFLAAIDNLVRQGVEGPLADATQVVYVSPLKALSNDIRRNLEAPLAGIRAELRRSGLPDVEIRTWQHKEDGGARGKEIRSAPSPGSDVSSSASPPGCAACRAVSARLATARAHRIFGVLIDLQQHRLALVLLAA